MRITGLLRRPECAVYLVECRFHERPGWISERSDAPELIYPLEGGFLLRHGGGGCVCLPARLSVVPAGAVYEIGHFHRLPDRTLVVRLHNPDAAPANVSHLFLEPAEAAALQLLAAALRDGADIAAGATASKLLLHIGRRLAADAISHSSIVARAGRLERALAHLLRCGASATVAECAGAADLGEFHFRHLFRDRYATTPHAVRRTLRMAQAVRIMLEGGTATSAARIAGFTHVSHLSGEFRRLIGRSPSALLRAHEVNGAREAAVLWHGA